MSPCDLVCEMGRSPGKGLIDATRLLQVFQLVAAAKEEDSGEAQKKRLEHLRNRIQQRVDVLLKYGRTLTDERREQLLQCDIKVTLETPDTTAEPT